MFPTNAGEDKIWVKICGITNLADALAAIEAGADALGFVFVARSRRYLDPRTAADWILGLPSNVMRVAVMADPTWDDLITTAAMPFIDVIQLHGRESPLFCRRVAERGIAFTKAIPVDVTSDGVESAHDFSTKTILLDSQTERGFGGTGKTFNWQAGRKFVEEHPDLHVVVAGGLAPENVEQAIRQMRPYGVDVTTGVEWSAGRKDPARVRDFIAAARSA
jgi:phosphoribosylanthranilate isomerase